MAEPPTSDRMNYPVTTPVGASRSGEFRPSRPGERRGGRQKGTPNKATTTLREAILKAAELAGDELKTEQTGLVAYLKYQAATNPASFLPLLSKVLPKEIEAGVNVRHTLEDYVLASLKLRKEREAREATADPADAVQVHALESAPQIEQRAEFKPPAAVVHARPAASDSPVTYRQDFPAPGQSLAAFMAHSRESSSR